jgi:hypothetical protein
MVRGANAVLSRTKKSRRIPSAAVERHSANGHSAAAEEPVAAQNGSPPDVFSPAAGDQQRDGAAPRARASSRRALKNWRVRSRLFLLVIIPTVAAVVLGGIRISSAVQSALVYQRVVQMANLNAKITGLVDALQREREDTVEFIVLGETPPNGGRGSPVNVPANSSVIPSKPELELLHQDYANSSGWANQVKDLAGSIDGSYPTLAQQDAQSAVTAINDQLPAIRQSATAPNSQLPALNVINAYTSAINNLLAFGNQIAVGSSDTTLAGSVRSSRRSSPRPLGPTCSASGRSARSSCRRCRTRCRNNRVTKPTSATWPPPASSSC